MQFSKHNIWRQFLLTFRHFDHFLGIGKMVERGGRGGSKRGGSGTIFKREDIDERSSTESAWTQITKYFIHPLGSKISKCLSSSARGLCSRWEQKHRSAFTNRPRAKQFALLKTTKDASFKKCPLLFLRFVTLRGIEPRFKA